MGLAPNPPIQQQADNKKHKKQKTKNKNIKNGKIGKILCWNKGNSTFSVKKPEIEILIGNHNPLMMGILEANMGENCYTPALQIDGYNLERDNLMDEGGITRTAVYIKEGMDYIRRKDLEVKATPAIWIEVSPNTASAWLILIAYREWCSLLIKDKKEKIKSRSINQQLVRLEACREKIREAEKEQKPLFVIGDWNIDVSPWLTPESTLTSYQESQADLLESLRELASENSLELINSPPTRRQGKDKPSILDIVLSNRPDQIQNLLLLPSSSDHLIQVIEKVIKQKIKTPGPRKMRCFKQYSKQRMIEALNLQMLDSLMYETETNLVANVLIMHITEAINKIAPIKLIQPRAQYAPYLSPETKEQMKHRDLLRLTANNSGDEDDYKSYKNARKSP